MKGKFSSLKKSLKSKAKKTKKPNVKANHYNPNDTQISISKTTIRPTRKMKFQAFFFYFYLYYFTNLSLCLILFIENSEDALKNILPNAIYCGTCILIFLYLHQKQSDLIKTEFFKFCIFAIIIVETLIFTHVRMLWDNKSSIPRAFFLIVPFLTHILVVCSMLKKIYRLYFIMLDLGYILFYGWFSFDLTVFNMLFELISYFLVILMVLCWYFYLDKKKNLTLKCQKMR